MTAHRPDDRNQGVEPAHGMHASRLGPMGAAPRRLGAGSSVVALGQRKPRIATEVDGDLKLATRLVLSRVIAHGTAKRPQTAQLCRALEYYARCRGADLRRFIPDPPHGPWPDSAAVLRRLGTTQRALYEELAQVEDLTNPHGTLSDSILTQFFPPRLWPVLEMLVLDGPGQAKLNAERALREYARRTVPATKRRPEGPPTRGTISILHVAFARVFRLLVDLHVTRPSSRVLSAWTGVPPVSSPALPAGGLQTEGPPLHDIRLALRRLDENIASKLRIEPGDDELAAIEAMSLTPLLQASLFRSLRARVALALLMVTGARVGAIAALELRDLRTNHRCRGGDERCGPAVVLRPGKSLPYGSERIKMIPRDVQKTIDVYLRYLDVVAETLSRWRQGSWGTPPIRTASTPLLVRGRQSWTPWGAGGIGRMLSGRTPSSSGRAGMLPLIPRRSGFNLDCPEEHHCFIGYNPHAFRHTASRLAEKAGAIWNEEHSEAPGDNVYSPEAYAAALLDHEMPGSKMRALYGDRDSEATREILAARASNGIWELLTTDAGARKQPDLQRFQRCVEVLEALDRDAADVKQRFKETVHRAKRKEVDSDRALLELLDLNQIRDELGREREQTARELESLRHDRRTWLAIPDEVESVPPIDLAEWDGSVHTQDEAIGGVAVREWLTPTELAYVAGCRQSTVTRWLKDEHLPNQDRRPWDAGEAPVDESLGIRFRRIWVQGIKQSFWSTQAMRDRRDQVLARWPDTQGWCIAGEPGPRCRSPLVLSASKA